MRVKSPFVQYIDSSLWVVDIASIYKTPFIILLPLCLVIWFVSLFQVISVKDAQYLLTIANKSESPLLIAAINKRNGRPFMFDLWSIKNKLRARRNRASRKSINA